MNLTVTDTLFKGNKDVDTGGGAIRSHFGGSGGSTHVYRSSAFLKNSTGGSGGAIEVTVFTGTIPGGLELRIENSVFLANKAARGGALDLTSQTNSSAPSALVALEVRHATFVGNKAQEDGGALLGEARLGSGATLNANVVNSILWGNKAGGMGWDVFLSEQSGASTTGTFDQNNVGDVSTGAGVTFSNTDAVNDDPMIRKKDGRLKADSPMIDKVACAGLSHDIDGDSRPHGVLCDIGADEFVP